MIKYPLGCPLAAKPKWSVPFAQTESPNWALATGIMIIRHYKSLLLRRIFPALQLHSRLNSLKGPEKEKLTANHLACLNISTCLVYFSVYRCFRLQKAGLSPYKQRLHTKVISLHTFSPSNNKPKRGSASSGLICLRRQFPPLTVNNICHQIKPPVSVSRVRKWTAPPTFTRKKRKKSEATYCEWCRGEYTVMCMCWYNEVSFCSTECYWKLCDGCLTSPN